MYSSIKKIKKKIDKGKRVYRITQAGFDLSAYSSQVGT